MPRITAKNPRRIAWALLVVGCVGALAFAQTTTPATDPAAQPTTAAVNMPVTEPTTAPADALATQPSTMPMDAAATQPSSTQASATQPARVVATQSNSSRDSRRHHSAQESSSNGPATGPVNPLASQYSVLMNRSIFIKGSQRVRDDFAYRNGNDAGATSRPAQDTTAASSSATAESHLVFSGVTLEDDRADALIEDVNTGSQMIVRSGEPLARGKVADINFDYMDYVTDGKTLRIAVGQNLEGNGVAASTQPVVSSGGSTTNPSDAGGDDVLARLRRRRQQELGAH
jgi:hypothetical protein